MLAAKRKRERSKKKKWKNRTKHAESQPQTHTHKSSERPKTKTRICLGRRLLLHYYDFVAVFLLFDRFLFLFTHGCRCSIGFVWLTSVINCIRYFFRFVLFEMFELEKDPSARAREKEIDRGVTRGAEENNSYISLIWFMMFYYALMIFFEHSNANWYSVSGKMLNGFKPISRADKRLKEERGLISEW